MNFPIILARRRPSVAAAVGLQESSAENQKDFLSLPTTLSQQSCPVLVWAVQEIKVRKSSESEFS